MPEAEQIDTSKKPAIFLHTVEVEIADEEMTARTSRLLDVLNKIDSTEADKASRVSDLNADLKQLRKEAQKIRATINTRKEKRDVECYEQPDERRNIVFIVRASDNKVLDERAMTLEDRMHLGKSREEAKKADTEANGSTEEPAGNGDTTEDDKAIERESAAAKGQGGGGKAGGKSSVGKVIRIKPSDAKKRKAAREAKDAADKARQLADENDAANAAASEDGDDQGGDHDAS